MMQAFSDIARRLVRKAGAALARAERVGLDRQPVELIPGMTAAPEPCFLIADHWSPERHPANAIAQPKIDGIRALALQSRIVTRQALPLDAALHCLPALQRLQERFDEPMVFDGEYQEPEGFAATLSAHKRGVGYGTFYLFDAVPYREWKANRFIQPLLGRLERIEKLMPDDEPFLAFLPPVAVPTAAHVHEFADAAWTRDCEGLVVKAGNGTYQRGRCQGWFKHKRSATLDGPVTDLIVPDHDMKRAVALVRLDGRVHKVAVPAELHLLVRLDLLGRDDGLTGKMVEVSFVERTETGALRGARIARLRPDKEIG